MSKRGLYQKYTVFEVGTTKQVEGFHFVLRPASDSVAFDALLRYAKLTPNRQLATDLDRKLRKIANQAAAVKNLESFRLSLKGNRKSALEILEMLIASLGSKTIIDAIHALENKQGVNER